MSTVKNQSDISGVFGESISFRKVAGKLVAKNRPVRKMPEPSVQQVAVQKRFLKAAKYAKLQTADKNALKLYTTGITPKKKSAYMVALNDHLTSPVVESINAIKYCGAIGDLIVVRASDDFMVASVTVTITDAAGGIIEQGEASKKPLTDDVWEYKSTVANPAIAGTKITAIAYDNPGNDASLEKVLA